MADDVECDTSSILDSSMKAHQGAGKKKKDGSGGNGTNVFDSSSSSGVGGMKDSRQPILRSVCLQNGGTEKYRK